MGNKVNPTGFRVGFSKGWNSCWFAHNSVFKDFFAEDYKLKITIRECLKGIFLTNIVIERVFGSITVYIECQEPGLIIGKDGERIKKLNNDIERIFKKKIQINVIETRNKSLNAKIIVDTIANKINERIPYKRVVKQCMESVMASRAEGIKVLISGRIGGAEIARNEKFCLGKVSNHTLRSDIDYFYSTAETVYGTLGIKVWIANGESYRNNLPLLFVPKINSRYVNGQQSRK